MNRSEFRHLTNLRPTDFTFDRQSGIKEWEWKDHRPPLDWRSIWLLSLAGFAIVALIFIGWRSVL